MRLRLFNSRRSERSVTSVYSGTNAAALAVLTPSALAVLTPSALLLFLRYSVGLVVWDVSTGKVGSYAKISRDEPRTKHLYTWPETTPALQHHYKTAANSSTSTD